MGAQLRDVHSTRGVLGCRRDALGAVELAKQLCLSQGFPASSCRVPMLGA